MKKTSYLLLLSALSIFAFSSCDKVQSDTRFETTTPTPAPTVNNSANTTTITDPQNANLNSNNSETSENEANSPEKTVQAFYKALKKKNRQESLKFAKFEVVERLLKERKSKLNWRFTGCEEPKVKEYGDAVCFYDFENGGIGLFLRKTSNEQYQVVSTYYYDEN